MARVAGAAFSTLLSLGTAVAQLAGRAEQQTSLAQIGGESQASGSIGGTVTDQSGGVIPRASVTLINQNTGLEFHSTANDAGLFQFTSLARGVYTAKIEAAGFRTFQRKDVILGIQKQLRVDVTLEVGIITMGGSIVAASK